MASLLSKTPSIVKSAGGGYVIWLHAATMERFNTYYSLQLNDRPPVRTSFVGIDRKPGQEQAERLQWQRVFINSRDAGTRFSLSQGSHTLRVGPWGAGRDTGLLVDGVLITNDESYIPPGARFLF